jgi:hypothetical protein
LIGAVLAQLGSGVLISVLMIFLFVVLRVALRSNGMAFPLFVLISGSARTAGLISWAAVPVILAGGSIRAFVLLRVGLIAAIGDAFVWTMFESAPITLRTSVWYASAGTPRWSSSWRLPALGSKPLSQGGPF